MIINDSVIKPEALAQHAIRRAAKYLEDALHSEVKDTRYALLNLAIEAINVAKGATAQIQ